MNSDKEVEKEIMLSKLLLGSSQLDTLIKKKERKLFVVQK